MGEYISAESKKLIPELKALSRRQKDWDKEFCSPNVIVPVITFIQFVEIKQDAAEAPAEEEYS